MKMDNQHFVWFVSTTELYMLVWSTAAGYLPPCKIVPTSQGGMPRPWLLLHLLLLFNLFHSFDNCTLQ